MGVEKSDSKEGVMLGFGKADGRSKKNEDIVKDMEPLVDKRKEIPSKIKIEKFNFAVDAPKIEGALRGLRDVSHVDIKEDGIVLVYGTAQIDLLIVMIKGLGLDASVMPQDVAGTDTVLNVGGGSTIGEESFKQMMKKVSLVMLTVQNCAMILTLKYSRMPGQEGPDGKMYLPTTAVVLGEVAKILISVGVILYTKSGVMGFIKEVNQEMVKKPVECLKLLVPSLLYTVQNNLMYIAMSHISAAVFQVTMQLKILTTAMFSVLILGKVLGPAKWGGLAVLTVGCVLVNLDQAGSQSSKKVQTTAHDSFIGLVCTLLAAMTSGLAGVYFEKLLKGAQTSLWIRQIQLGLGGVCIGLFGAFVTDGEHIEKDGFFQGYTNVTWSVIALSSGGGLLVAVVVKYADNLYKAFAVSLSIVLSTIVSIWVFNFTISIVFFIGAALVLLSLFLYESMVPFNAQSIAVLVLSTAAAGILLFTRV